MAALKAEPSMALVVLPAEALSDLVTRAVALALENEARPTFGLHDRASIAQALNTSTATVDRLVRQGMPHLLVGEARRFELPTVLEWLRTRGKGGDHGAG